MSALPVLMYHHVSPSPGLVTVSPETFRAHIKALAEDGWQSAGLDAVEACLAGLPLAKKTVVITFDDGYLDNAIYAHPVLAEFGFTAVLFLATGWIGDGPLRQGSQPTPEHGECKRRIASGEADSVMLRWSEVEALRAAGTFEFHSHTHTHTRWDKTVADPEARAAALRDDLLASRQTLAARLGTAGRHLCWPQGYYDAQYIDVARECGFDYLYTTEKRINKAGSDPLRIGRIVTKEKGGDWLLSRTRMYSRPFLGQLYVALRGQ